MKHKLILLLTALFTLSVIFTAQATTMWKCTAYTRSGNQSWPMKRFTRYDAITAARSACRQEAWHPHRCIVPNDSCVRINIDNDGNRCFARDNHNRRWFSRGHKDCRKALRRCNHWHNNRGDDNWRCWVPGWEK
ncbi:MAG: hypothetical protein COB66_06070 [Coxiella sp. (in: Bacteria)]|nr:MAG: hypothetical protein COB66_06070 [Coxiella sp. (in: g-proteobacteria)]